MNKISVIVPVYNVVNELVKCVTSIQNQTYDNIEIILVDDGSNDGSRQLCDKLAAQDKRIKVVHQENQGVASARKNGFLRSSGGVLSFVDSDDFIEADMYERMLKYIQTGCDMVFCDYNSIKRKKIEKNYFFAKDLELNRDKALKFLSDDSIRSFMWNKLYRKDVLHEDDFYVGELLEDYLCMPNIVKRCKKIGYKRGCYYSYVRRIGSIMSDGNIMYVYWKACLKKMIWYKENCPQYVSKCLNRVVRVGLTCIEDKCLIEIEEQDIKNFFKSNIATILKNSYLNLHKKIKVLYYIN